MPELNDAQFSGWKANPNQMALPGMEDLSHPGAHVLAQGYHFEHTVDEFGTRSLWAMKGTHLGGYLQWQQHEDYEPRGEIQMVKTEDRGRGLASSMYGMGRTMARVKPVHSIVRSRLGNEWAHKVSERYRGRIPPGR